MKFGDDSGASPKPKGALAAMLVGGPTSPDDDSDMEMDTDHGFRALAKAFGIPPEREAAAQAALKQYVKSCMSEPDEDDSEDY